MLCLCYLSYIYFFLPWPFKFERVLQKPESNSLYVYTYLANYADSGLHVCAFSHLCWSDLTSRLMRHSCAEWQINTSDLLLVLLNPRSEQLQPLSSTVNPDRCQTCQNSVTDETSIRILWSNFTMDYDPGLLPRFIPTIIHLRLGCKCVMFGSWIFFMWCVWQVSSHSIETSIVIKVHCPRPNASPQSSNLGPIYNWD